MKITIVAGARPNFMKIAPIIRAINEHNIEGPKIEFRLVHTGQHYDKKMSDDFFVQLRIPQPDNNLGVGSGTQAAQTAAIMVGFEKELQENRPDLVLVVGDVTSTMACAITAKKLCIDVAHVEAGIRSGDLTMPEEINRIVTDSITDIFFTTTQEASQTLEASGKTADSIFFVGNTMIDTLFQNLENLQAPAWWKEEEFTSKEYFLVTLHRPANVDDMNNLVNLLQNIMKGTSPSRVIFPVHPRTKKVIDQSGYAHPHLYLTDPLPYLEFLYLVKNAKAVITDSGGITEETTVLSVPCMTLRNSTERPETITIGSNELVGTDPVKLVPFLVKVNEGNWKKGSIPALWDGHTSERIVKIIADRYQ